MVAVDTETTSPRSDAGGAVRHLARGRARTGLLHSAAAIAEGGDGRPVRRRARAGQIEADALARLKPLLEDASVLKIGQNLKYDWLVLAQHGIRSRPSTTRC